jgi:hypothetical protein
MDCVPDLLGNTSGNSRQTDLCKLLVLGFEIIRLTRIKLSLLTSKRLRHCSRELACKFNIIFKNFLVNIGMLFL